jgi:predicted RNase H-like nuclease (RuvC/YqgF family)
MPYPCIYGLNPSMYPSRLGAPWTDEERIKLLNSIKKNELVSNIAKSHNRTEGGITAQLKQLATDYYCNDNKSIPEIQIITGLTKDTIIDAIQRREWKNQQKESKNKQKEEDKQKEKNEHTIRPIEEYLKEVKTSDQELLLNIQSLIIKLGEKVDYLSSKIL